MSKKKKYLNEPPANAPEVGVLSKGKGTYTTLDNVGEQPYYWFQSCGNITGRKFVEVVHNGDLVVHNGIQVIHFID